MMAFDFLALIRALFFLAAMVVLVGLGFVALCAISLLQMMGVL